MNGPHDMGGMQCFGTVVPEADEPVFHEEWEKKVLALTVAMGFCGAWNIDASRHARESLPPPLYLGLSYYQIWIAGLEKLLLERDMVSADELKNGRMEVDPVDVKRVVKGADMGAALAAGGPASRDTSSKAVFKPGDKVRARNFNPTGHTRLPQYVRGAPAIIAKVQGCHVWPDTNAAGEGENPHWLYSVAFDARDLFGDAAEVGNTVMVDCWEPYLEQA